jgi:hypothetical protein
VEESRFRQWEQKLISERDRLNKDLEATHAAYVLNLSNLCWIVCTNLWQHQISRARDRRPAGLRHPQPRSSLEWCFKKGVDTLVFTLSSFLFLEYPMSCNSRASEGAPLP